MSSLNEGRGVNPGDTRNAPAAELVCDLRAQRRPGREPRRHAVPTHSVFVPAVGDAQRRPGREPRRHAPAHAGCRRPARPLNEGRGVNPGDTAAADYQPLRHHARSTKAGA